MRFLDRLRVIRAKLLGVSLMTAALFTLGPAVAARASAPSATWKGAAPGVAKSDAYWSLGANWEAGVAPNASEGIATLTFPRLTTPTCESATPADTCYLSFNNLVGLSVEALKLDDGDEYLIAGEPFTLGSGGLSATPASGSAGEAADVVEAPIQLGASQDWQLAGRGGPVAENGLVLFDGTFGSGSVSGSGSSLSVELSEGPLFFLDKTDTEVGPLTISGANTGAIASNGLFSMLAAKLNSSDSQPVSVSHVFFAGSGAIGPLSTSDTDLDVGAVGEDLEVASAKLGSGTSVEFTVTGEGTTPAADYAQLVSRGAVALEGAKVEVVVRPPNEGAACPVLSAGETYTFVSSTGALSGAFENAPEGGAEIPVRYGPACAAKPSQTIAISYRESGPTETVTGTVEEAAFRQRQEEEAKTRGREEEEAAARRKAEEASAHGPSGAAGPGTTPGGTVVAPGSAPREEVFSEGGGDEIAALLSRELTPTGTSARIASVLSAGGYTISFSAPAAGTAVLEWYELPHGGKASAAKTKPLLVASGRLRFSKAGRKKLRIKLTASGRSLLSHSQSVKLTAKGTFTPSGEEPVVVTKSFVLRR